MKTLKDLFKEDSYNPFKTTAIGITLILEKDINLDWKIINAEALKKFPDKKFDFDNPIVDEILSNDNSIHITIPFAK